MSDEPPPGRDSADGGPAAPSPGPASSRAGGGGPGTPPLSGFSIIKNASLYDLPVEAALRSALRICDEVVVNVGVSRDDTLQRVRALERPELRILHTDWRDPEGTELRELSEETNRAMDACRHDWALYLQADEVLHEDDTAALRAALAEADRDPRVEGLLFDYLHFEGSPRWVVEGRRRYRREVRVVRRSSGIRSVRDAQGFRVGGADGREPRVIRSGARVFHYGYVKRREALDRKRRQGEVWYGRPAEAADPFRFVRYRGLRRWPGDHPEVARDWLAERDRDFDPAGAEPPPRDLRTLRVRVSDAIERWTGHRLFESRNYELIE